jgi:hypothetical protein
MTRAVQIAELGDQNVFNIDGTTNKVGVGTTNPNAVFTAGAVGASGTSLFVHGDARVVGVITATSFSGDLSGNATSATSATSATTATNAQGLTGTPNITVGTVSATTVSVAGTLTYNDVTNIDAVGIITARSGVNVSGNGLVVVGVSTFNDDIKGDNATNISGISSVTATSYFGSGQNLTNLPASGDSNDITASLFL